MTKQDGMKYQHYLDYDREAEDKNMIDDLERPRMGMVEGIRSKTT